jgi:hypothetical protein
MSWFVSDARTGRKLVNKTACRIENHTFWRSLRHCPQLYLLASFRGSVGKVHMMPCTRLGSKCSALHVELISRLLVAMHRRASTSSPRYRTLALPELNCILRKAISSCRWRTRSRLSARLPMLAPSLTTSRTMSSNQSVEHSKLQHNKSQHSILEAMICSFLNIALRETVCHSLTKFANHHPNLEGSRYNAGRIKTPE